MASREGLEQLKPRSCSLLAWWEIADSQTSWGWKGPYGVSSHTPAMGWHFY